MNSLPSVSVLIATYNRFEFIEASIKSACRQSFLNYDIIVVDDGSNQQTKDLLAKLSDENPNVKILYEDHKGVASARQKGLLASNNDLVCILDSDDILKEDALEKLVDYYLNSKADFVYCNNCEFVNEESKINLAKVRESKYPRFKNNRRFIHSIFSSVRVPYKHTGSLYNRKLALRLGGYDTTLPSKIDIDLILKFLTNDTKVELLDEYLVFFRLHKNSISSGRIKGLKYWYLLIDKYVYGSSILKFYYKVVKGIIELSKYVYIRIVAKK